MPDSGPSLPRLHEDAVLFREAVNFTAARTGFSQRLVEKDYFCTLMLAYFSSAAPELVFKGGTCLARVHAEFYRLSEDMDFVIPVAEDAPRSERSRLAAGVKKAASDLHRTLPVFHMKDSLRGANRSTQYVGSFAYESPTSGDEETVKLEVGLREPLAKPILRRPARSVMLNPVTGESMVPPVAAASIDLSEAYAEKFRAALTRRDVAIRDYYDIAHGVTRLGLKVRDDELVRLVKGKLAVRDNPPVDVSDERLRRLRAQMNTDLRPVLRPKDFDEFDLEHAIGVVGEMARAVGT